MKKRYILAGIAGATIAYKLAKRPRNIDWELKTAGLPFADKSRFVEVDGVKIHYQEFGDANAPPVLMIHGYSASTFTWSNAAPKLANKGFRVLVVDLIGFGFSEKPFWYDYTIDGQARMISHLMYRLEIGQATIVGSSYGGAVAAVLALDYPEQVSKLVLVSAVSNDGIKNSPLTTLATTPFIGDVMAPFLVSSKTYIKIRLRNSLNATNYHLIDDNRLNSIMRPLVSADSHNALIATLKNWRANRIERDAHQIKHPTLLIWGENDKIVPLRNGEKLHNEIEDSRLVIFKNCGHVPHEEFTDDFVNIVSEF